MNDLKNIFKAKNICSALVFHFYFWLPANREQRDLLNSWLKPSNPNYDFLSYYLDK